jgi:O-antigen/teichoic acid export membrane protein
LVAATLTQATLSAAIGGIVTLRGVSIGHKAMQRRHFLSFGGRFALIGFFEFLTNSFDAVVVGKFLGPASAGLYNRAQLLANLPADRPAGILTRALFPFLSALHSEREKQAVGVQLSLILVGGYAFAVSAGVAVAAPDIVGVLLGQRWQSVAPLLRILSLAVGPMFVTHIVGTTFDSLGLLRQKLTVQVGMLVTLVIAVASLYSVGLAGIALAVVIAETIRATLYVWLLHREFRFSPRVWWTCTCIAITNAVAVGTGTSLAFLLAPGDVPILLRLVIDMLGAAAGLLAAAIVLRPLLGELEAVRVARARVPILDRYLSVRLRKPTIGANQ